jgi:hypothetical protein
MKKLLILLTLVSIDYLAQGQSEKYIELVARVDWYGDAIIHRANFPAVKNKVSDTIINIKMINALVKSSMERKERPIQLINELNGYGWTLVTMTFMPIPEQGLSTDKGRIIYYLKKRL